jgi:transcriptional regulator with XRE-family HTH domain
MGMKAVGLYLRRLREAKYSNRELIASALKVDDTQIGRLEAGGGVRYPFFFNFAIEVDADFLHIVRLISSDDTAAADKVAEALAQDRLTELMGQKTDLHRDERYKEVDELIAKLIDHPRQFDKWLGYAANLLAELNDTR